MKDNNIGIAGVAYDSKILPVRIAYSDINGNWVLNYNNLATAINWSVQNGADVISNSYRLGSNSTTVNNAITNAVNNGRNGKGCVVLFATGNDNSSVSYPATLSNVIAVGATSMCDERKTHSSCDGEGWWGSNYGSELDVVAPGVEIYTTDISGSSGYNSGDYYSSFNGTSSACPQVAGVAALILSINTDLTQVEVREILESTTDKIPNYTYTTSSSHPNGTWNSKVGYGRINALKAVAEANLIGGPIEMCIGDEITYTYTGSIPSGATISWGFPSNRMYVISGQGTASCTFGAFSSGTNNNISFSITNNGITEFYTKNINILYSGYLQTPSIVIAPDNPTNLICCGQTYTFNHAVCSYGCTNLEWDFTVYYQSTSDYYGFSTSGGYGSITAQKNTYAPLIVGAKARNISENCGNPSSWSNEISRYYGTVSSSSREGSSYTNYNSALPINEYYINNENNLYVETIDLYKWLDFKYTNKNLDKNEIDKIIQFIYH